MEVTIDIPDYNLTDGLKSHWEYGFTIEVLSKGDEVHIRANKAGLISLAIQFLTLAQDEVQVGRHFHYDSNNSLEEGSTGLIIEKLDF